MPLTKGRLGTIKEGVISFFKFWGKKAIFSPKNGGTMKNVIALNLYIGTNVLVYERWLVLKVWYTAGCPAQRFRHSIDSHCLCM